MTTSNNIDAITADDVVFTIRQILLICLVGFVCAIAARVTAAYMQRAYRGEVTLMVASDDSGNGLASLAGQLGGVASFLGGNLGTRDQLDEAMATLRSRQLAVEFLQKPGRLDKVVNVLWPDSKDRPQPDQIVNQAAGFLRKIAVAVAEDPRLGTIRLSFTWPDRKEAADWANEYVAEANRVMRDRTVADSRKRIDFLKEAASKSDSVALRDAIFRLMETQIKAEMLATTRPDYALRVIDPAVVPDAASYVRPMRWLMTLGGLLIGAFVTAAALLVRRAVRRSPKRWVW